MISPTDILHAKILIVDDQKANAFLLEQLLRRAGYVSIASTKNPGEVYKLHFMNHYDLILLDLEMPGMDGFQVMEDLNQVESGGFLPVMVLTAHPAHRERALECGASEFISKPFALNDVLSRVHKLLEARLSHKAARQDSSTPKFVVRQNLNREGFEKAASAQGKRELNIS
jgi:adenylate cyclase